MIPSQLSVLSLTLPRSAYMNVRCRETFTFSAGVRYIEHLMDAMDSFIAFFEATSQACKNRGRKTAESQMWKDRSDGMSTSRKCLASIMSI